MLGSGRLLSMALSDEAASDEVQLALAALTKSIPIVTRSMILAAQRGEYALSYEPGLRIPAL